MTDIPLDTFATFLLFLLIGQPILNLQSMPPEVRRVMLRRPRRLLLMTSLPIVSALILIVLGIAVRATLLPDCKWVLDINGSQRQLRLSCDEFIWLFDFFALFLIALTASIVIPNRLGRREVIISNLENEISQRISQEGPLLESPLEDLIELGIQSEPGQDKQLVLGALYNITIQVHRYLKYRGDALEKVITRLGDIVGSDPKPGNSDNFRTAGYILRRTVIEYNMATTEFRPTDLQQAILEIGDLSRAVLAYIGTTLEAEGILMSNVEALELAANYYPAATTDVGKALFKLGMMAIGRNQPLVATQALDKLFDLIDFDNPAQSGLIAQTLGLASYFWAYGEAARDHVRVKLSQIKQTMSRPLREELEVARRSYARTLQFQTADHLRLMILDIE